MDRNKVIGVSRSKIAIYQEKDSINMDEADRLTRQIMKSGRKMKKKNKTMPNNFLTIINAKMRVSAVSAGSGFHLVLNWMSDAANSS